MSSSSTPGTTLPFPTRFPPPPRLALARRRWPASDSPSENESDASGEHSPTAVERLAHQVELALALRERAVADAEAHLSERVRDLDEMEALLRAREALLSAARLRDKGNHGVVTLREADALNQLRDELDRQETSLREARQALLEREQFLERSETQLSAKLQQQQERETELDQREENVTARETRLGTPAPTRPYDEFRE